MTCTEVRLSWIEHFLCWNAFFLRKSASSPGEDHSLIYTWINADLQVLKVDLPPLAISFLLVRDGFYHIFSKRTVFHLLFLCSVCQILEMCPCSIVTETSCIAISSWMTTKRNVSFCLQESNLLMLKETSELVGNYVNWGELKKKADIKLKISVVKEYSMYPKTIVLE